MTSAARLDDEVLRAEAVGIRLQTLLYKLAGLGSEGGVVAKALEPADVRFPAKPGELTLGVVAVCLTGCGDGFGFGEFAAQDGAGLAVAEGIEGGGRVAIFAEESAGFFHETVGEHLRGARIDAGVEIRAGRIESDAEDAIAGERVASRFPGLGERLAGSEADFDRADELGLVVGVDAPCGGGIEAMQDTMEPCGAVQLCAVREPGADFFRALGAGKEAFEEARR